MSSHSFLRTLVASLGFLSFVPHGYCQTSSASSSAVIPSTTPTTAASSIAATTISPAASASTSTPPDVLLNVPNLSVGRIELDVDNLQADINLNAQVAGLVSLNAGVQVSVTKINVTITEIEAELE